MRLRLERQKANGVFFELGYLRFARGVGQAHFIDVEDKTFLHKNHKSHEIGKFHLKLIITSLELKKMSKIESTKKIYNILDKELKTYIHSIQILIL